MISMPSRVNLRVPFEVHQGDGVLFLDERWPPQPGPGSQVSPPEHRTVVAHSRLEVHRPYGSGPESGGHRGREGEIDIGYQIDGAHLEVNELHHLPRDVVSVELLVLLAHYHVA